MRKYTLNEEFFDELNEKSVYWLGFLYADGCVRKRKSSELRLKLKKEDKSHIEKFNNDFLMVMDQFIKLRNCQIHILYQFVQIINLLMTSTIFLNLGG